MTQRTATLIEADGSTREVHDVPEGSLSITVPERDQRGLVMTSESLAEAFRFRSVAEILRGPRSLPHVPIRHRWYKRDLTVPGFAFRFEGADEFR